MLGVREVCVDGGTPRSRRVRSAVLPVEEGPRRRICGRVTYGVARVMYRCRRRGRRRRRSGPRVKIVGEGVRV